MEGTTESTVEETVPEQTVPEQTETEDSFSDLRETDDSMYKTKPPNPYPGEKTIPESGEDFEAYNQIVDNDSKDRFTAPRWSSGKGGGSYEGRFRVGPKSGNAAARYKVRVPATDVYSVFAWWPGGRQDGTKARIGVETMSGTKWTEVSQDVDGGYWVPIGEYELRKGDGYRVKIKGVQGAEPPVADTIGIVRGIGDLPPDPEYLGAVGEDPALESSEAQFSGASVGVRRIPPRVIMRRARSHLGTPYKLGGLNVCIPRKWEDCSCFTRLVFRKWRTLADSPVRQMKATKMARIRRPNIRRGDLLFHDTTGDGRMSAYDHVSIYAGNGYVIHANSYYLYKKVHFQKMKWLSNYKGARRVRY